MFVILSVCLPRRRLCLSFCLPRRRLCSQCGLFVILSVCLSVSEQHYVRSRPNQFVSLKLGVMARGYHCSQSRLASGADLLRVPDHSVHFSRAHRCGTLVPDHSVHFSRGHRCGTLVPGHSVHFSRGHRCGTLVPDHSVHFSRGHRCGTFPTVTGRLHDTAK